MATDLENMPKIGSLYRLDLDGSLHAMVRNIGISNGLARSLCFTSTQYHAKSIVTILTHLQEIYVR